MKKWLIGIIIFLLCGNVYGATISVDQFITPDDLTMAQLEDFRKTVVDAINSSDGALIQSGSVAGSALDDNASPVKRWDENFGDFVFTGLTPDINTASLTTDVNAGTAYIEGTRVVKTATSNTYTASRHTFLDLSSNGTYTFSAVTIDASEPSVTANSIRLGRVSTDSTGVIAFRDDRQTTLPYTTAGFNDGTAANPSINYNNDTDTGYYRKADETLGFTVGGSQVAEMDSGGINSLVGSESAPGFSFITDPDTGLYQDSTNVLGITTGGSKTATFTSAQIRNLDGTEALPSYSFTSDTDTGLRYVSSGVMSYSSDSSETVLFNSVGVRSLQGSNTNPGFAFIDDEDTGIYRSAANELGIAVGTTQIVNIDGTSITALLGCRIGADSGDNEIDDASQGSASTTLYIGNESIDTTASDKRYKDVISLTSRGLDLLDEIKVYDYTWKESFKSDDRRIRIGLLAQDIYELDNALGRKPDDEETGLWSVQQDDLIALLIKSVQELKARIEVLESGTN